jgi:hypothetical protein
MEKTWRLWRTTPGLGRPSASYSNGIVNLVKRSVLSRSYCRFGGIISSRLELLTK